jgi:hypothetical protein
MNLFVLFGRAVDNGCRFGHQLRRQASNLWKRRLAAELNNFSLILSIYILPSVSALGQPLRMAAHTLYWGDLFNKRGRGGKRVTMVTMFVGGVGLMLDGIIVLFLP